MTKFVTIKCQETGERGDGMIFRNIFHLYYDGFRSMVVGRTLWKIIIVKLFIMFAILKVFFFPDFLATNFDTDAARAAHVLDNLTRTATDNH